MARRLGYDAKPIIALSDGDGDAWPRGFFHTSHANWDGRWIRNYDELRRRDIALFCLGDVAGKAVLDVACGSGLYMVVLGRMGAKVAGQDLSEQAAIEARLALKRFGLAGDAVVGDARQLLFEANSFDAVFSADFVEHIPAATKTLFLAEVFRVLKPGGTLVIKTPNRTYLKASIWVRRIAALLRGRPPLWPHIAHTRNNPDNEHHGLTTLQELRGLLNDQMFLSIKSFPQPLSGIPIPALQRLLPRLGVLGRMFNRDLIVRARKPLFLGFFP